MNKHLQFINKEKHWSIRLLIILLFGFLFCSSTLAQEGSANWTKDETSMRESSLYVPGNNAGNTGYNTRGSMMRPTSSINYDANHRFYVYVKKGETVFFGFKSATTSTFSWKYENTPQAAGKLYPTTVNTSEITTININGTNRIENNFIAEKVRIGPIQLNSNGYSGGSFTNNTGADRAFWMEVTTPGNNGFKITDWDVTVASGAIGNYKQEKGRVYCKYWSIMNGLPNTAGTPNPSSFHKNFGFYVPVDNTNTNENDYYIKRFTFPASNAGYVVFFANDSGPTNNLLNGVPNIEENRKSIVGVSNRYQYPLFVAEPDPSIWPNAPEPKASTKINFFRNPNGGGGYAVFNVTVDTPGITDILVDIDNSGDYSEGDVLIFKNFENPGTYQITWDGNNSLGKPVPNGTTVKLVTSIIFFPVHFPIYDMEQSLGMIVENIRPGKNATQKIYWDHSKIYEGGPGIKTGNTTLKQGEWGTIPRNKTGTFNNTNVQDIAINRTGKESPDNKWWADGDNGAVGNNNTINVYAGSQQEILEEVFPFNWDSSDIEVKKTINNTKPSINSNVIFTITVTNNGLMDARSVVILDLLPSGYQFINASPTKGSYSQTTGIWTIGPLANQAFEILTVTAKVNPSGNYTNIASIHPSSDLTDINTTDNTSSVTIVPDPFCTQPGNFTIQGLPTITGINTQSSTLTDWPSNIPNGFITMETTNKGFSITRITTTSAIATPSAGMIVYDISAKCIKLYREGTWNCITRTCNN